MGLLANETGCTFGFAMFQMGFVPGLFRQAAGLAYAPVGQVDPIGQSRNVRHGNPPAGRRRRRDRTVECGAHPLGTVDRLAPRGWQRGRAEAVQDSPFVGGLLWAEIFTEAGLPAGVLNVVTHAAGDGSKIGDEFAENPKVRRINFTGSSSTGRRIAEAAGRNLKRVVLELGGSNPLLVLRDADLEYAVNAAAFGAYLHQGQIACRPAASSWKHPSPMSSPAVWRPRSQA